MQRRDFLKITALSSLLFLESKIHSSDFLGISNKGYPNILILVFDAFSARHLTLANYARDTTPNLTRLSQKATVFHNHHAAGNYTTPGTSSLLTGVYPWKHRALHIRGKTTPFYEDHNLFSLFPKDYKKFAYTQNPLAYSILFQFHNHIDRLVKIPELAVYADSISQSILNPDFFIANEAELIAIKSEHSPPSSLFLSIFDTELRKFFTNRIYNSFSGDYPRGITSCQMGVPHSPCFFLQDAIDWLQKTLNTNQQPFFGYVHLMPPHAPYNPPYPYVSHFDDDWKPNKKPEHIFSLGKEQTNLNRKRRFYDQYIEFLDSEINRLFNYLEDSNLLDNTYIFITSDHGEMFERGIIDHLTPTLFEPVIHIPLFIFQPGQKQRVDFYHHTSAVDILPTILDIVGNSTIMNCEGVTLPLSEQENFIRDRNIYAVEAKQNAKNKPLTKASFAMIKGDYKLTLYRGYPETNGSDLFELYNLADDPEEIKNIYNPQDQAISKKLIDELLANVEANNTI
jgi:arylsulfatase A-like enzyme